MRAGHFVSFYHASQALFDDDDDVAVDSEMGSIKTSNGYCEIMPLEQTQNQYLVIVHVYFSKLKHGENFLQDNFDVDSGTERHLNTCEQHAIEIVNEIKNCLDMLLSSSNFSDDDDILQWIII